MDVGAGVEGGDEPRVLGQVSDAPQLDLVVVGDQQPKPSAGTNALRNWRPSSERTGMLCRFGWSDESRPVRATVWLNVAWMRPSGATSVSRPSPYVERSFSTSRYESSGSMIGCWSRSFSSEAASVEKPGLRLLLRRQAQLVEQDLAQLMRAS